jgi:hypothetical protein
VPEEEREILEDADPVLDTELDPLVVTVDEAVFETDGDPEVLGLELGVLDVEDDLVTEGEEVVVREAELDPVEIDDSDAEAVAVAVAVADPEGELLADVVRVPVDDFVEVVVPLEDGVLDEDLDPVVVLVVVGELDAVREEVVVGETETVLNPELEADTEAVPVAETLVEGVAAEERDAVRVDKGLLVPDDDLELVEDTDAAAVNVHVLVASADALDVLEFVGDSVLVLELLVDGDVVADLVVVRLPDTVAVFVTDVVDVLVPVGLGDPDLAAVIVGDTDELGEEDREPVLVLDPDAELVPVLEPVPEREPVGLALDERLPDTVVVVVTLELGVRLADAERLVKGVPDVVLELDTDELTVAVLEDVFDSVGLALVVFVARGDRVPVVDRVDVIDGFALAEDVAVEVAVRELVAVLDAVAVADVLLELVPLLELVGDAEEVRVLVAERDVVGDALALLVADTEVVDVRVEDGVLELEADVVPERELVPVRDTVEEALAERVDDTVRVLIEDFVEVNDARADKVDVIDDRELTVDTALLELERVAVADNVLKAATAANCLSRAGLTTIRAVSSNGDVSLYVDNTNRAKRPRRRIISLVDSAFFLKVPRGGLNTCAYYNRNIVTMSRPQVFTIIRGEKNSGCAYYTKGIHLCNIPLHEFTRIQLQKITLYRGDQFIYDLLPAFVKFQQLYRRRYKWIHNPRWILQRQLTGQPRGRLPWM